MLYDRTRHHFGDSDDCIRVLAATSPDGLLQLTRDLPDSLVSVWVSDLDEMESDSALLHEYAKAIMEARADIKMFALYGGFFSVLLSAVGLKGSCHGIGFGEYRAYPQLQRSGPPPPRYYMPTLHRYVLPDLAYQLWLHDPTLAECNCRICDGLPPMVLDYHSLMMHSVLCRAREIQDWVGTDLPSIIERLKGEHGAYLDSLARSDAPDNIKEEGKRVTEHLPKWIQALSSI